MFYIFDSSGRTFSGTLEALRRVEKPAHITPEQTIVRHPDTEDRPPAPSQDGNSSSYFVSKRNSQAYENMLKESGNREVVYHAYQIMSQPVQCISANWKLLDAVKQFRTFPFQAFPIVNSNKQLVGTLSRRHLYEFLLSENAVLESQQSLVANCLMNNDSKVYCADPITDVRRIATLLVENQLDAVPVVEDSGCLVGIVSRTNILKCAISDPPLSLWC